MIYESEKFPKNADIPADVAEAWAAVILDLALKADEAGDGDSDEVDKRKTLAFDASRKRSAANLSLG